MARQQAQDEIKQMVKKDLDAFQSLAREGWNIKPDVLAAIRCTLTGIKPGQSKKLGRPKLLSVQSLVRLFSRPLSNQADARVAFFDSTRLTPDT